MGVISMSKVTKDQYIKELEHDMGRLTDMVVELTEDNKRLKKDLEMLVLRVPSAFLTGLVKEHPNDFALGEKVREITTKSEDVKYIYESPDKGETVYRREAGDYDTPREQIDKDGNPLPTQMELF